MDKFDVSKRLMCCFPRNSFINSAGEFIAHRYANEYFMLDDCETELDVKCKVLEWLSRAAYKTAPYATTSANRRFHSFMLEGINKYLDTNFDEDDIERIYTKLGNRCNHPLTIRFVESGYNMALLGGDSV